MVQNRKPFGKLNHVLESRGLDIEDDDYCEDDDEDCDDEDCNDD